MALNNLGVGPEGLLAAQSVMEGDPNMLGNDSRVEELWAIKAMEHAEVYFNLLCSVEPARLKLSGSQELDDQLYKDFKESFPHLNIAKLTEDDLKTEKAKGRLQKKKTDYLVTLIKFPLTPTHHPPRMTYEKMIRCWKVYHPPTIER